MVMLMCWIPDPGLVTVWAKEYGLSLMLMYRQLLKNGRCGPLTSFAPCILKPEAEKSAHT